MEKSWGCLGKVRGGILVRTTHLSQFALAKAVKYLQLQGVGPICSTFDPKLVVLSHKKAPGQKKLEMSHFCFWLRLLNTIMVTKKRKQGVNCCRMSGLRPT